MIFIFRDYCIEYGAMYFGGEESLRINTVQTAEECRNECIGRSNCKYFSFREGRRNRKRCDLRNTAGFEVFSSPHATSGSVDGQCRSADIRYNASILNQITIKKFNVFYKGIIHKPRGHIFEYF